MSKTKIPITKIEKIKKQIEKGDIIEEKIKNALKNKYKLEKIVGEGVTSYVYKAKDLKLERYVALKICKSYKNNYIKQTFIEEAKNLARIKNPNIVTLYYINDELPPYYIAMEYLEGKTLKDIQKSEYFNIKKLISIFIKLGNTLEYLHKQGMIHRDIKPSNIILINNNIPRIIDFGSLVRIKNTKDITPEGTFPYMAPEHLNGKNIDHRVDIYSFGVMIYEVILKNRSNDKILNKNQIYEKLFKIYNKCTKKFPNERYSKMSNVVKDLKKLIEIKKNFPIIIKKPKSNSKVTFKELIEGSIYIDNINKIYIIVHPIGEDGYWIQSIVRVYNKKWITEAYFGSGAHDKGKHFEIMAVAKPYKRLREGDILNSWSFPSKYRSNIVKVTLK